MTNEEKLIDWMFATAHLTDSMSFKGFADLKERDPARVKRHLAVAKALLNNPPDFLVQAWERKAKKRKAAK